VLVEGKSTGAVNNAKGHLFEEFVAILLSKYGYDKPIRERLNFTANGIELDVRTVHKLSRQPAVAECKAYSTNLPAQMLTSFYGKLTTLRFDEPQLFGWFVGLPRLAPEGFEQATRIQERDAHFRAMSSDDVVGALLDLKEISDPRTTEMYSDFAVLVTEHGLYSAAKELDPETRLAQRVVVWSAHGEVPTPVLDLLEASSYAAGVSVRTEGDRTTVSPSLRIPPHEPTVVPVASSNSDFEYQRPASPKYFVGRRQIIEHVKRLAVTTRKGSVLVLNAQSGWGKSSLALRLGSAIEGIGGHALVVDSRTANAPDYVSAALRKVALEAQNTGVLKLPQSAAFSSLGSSLGTLAIADWKTKESPVLIFFDQFENVFRDQELTREFRDLALGVRDLQRPIIVGFAWKTDLVGWTEDHPYQLRDDIRSHAEVITVEPLGAPEIDTLLRRLEKGVAQKLHPELRQRLREYSQGYPWLFKKLAAHILKEIQRGLTQENLVAEALNVQSLFETDLAELSPSEHEGLRFIARSAPVVVSDALEQVSSSIVQSLLNRRLIIQVGERLDTYWDIFRDFLNTGRVPIEDSYILRMAPNSVGRLLRKVVAAGGDISVPNVAHGLGTSESVIFNLSRELRLLGVAAYEPLRVRLLPELQAAEGRESAIRDRVTSALKRHRAFSIVNRIHESRGGPVSIADFATELRFAFPAVRATPKTWESYARVFASWFSYAGLATVDRRGVSVGGTAESVATRLLTQPTSRGPVRGAFPHSAPGPSIALLADVAMGVRHRATDSRTRDAARELITLGAIEVDENGYYRLTESHLARPDGSISSEGLRDCLIRIAGGAQALSVLEDNPAAAPAQIGAILAEAQGTDWKEATRTASGKYFRAWARACGIRTTPRSYPHSEESSEPPSGRLFQSIGE
jgi:hypothetical protein